MTGNEDKVNARMTALRIGAVVLAVIMLLSAVFLFIKRLEKRFGDYAETSMSLDGTMSYNGQDYVLKDNIETILVLGLDKFGNEDSGSYNNDKQADFLLLFAIDNSAKTCKAVHINRDSMVEMNVLGVAGDKIGTETKQIALSHTYGNGREVSCRNTANSVSKLLLGVEIDHYVSVTMDAVPMYNDLVGGVTLEVLDDFTGIDDSMVKGETVTLNGEQALRYVRTRQGLDDPSNNNRMKRQKQYLEALYKQSHQLVEDDGSFVSRAALKMTDYLVSDCSGNKLEDLLNRLSNYKLEAILELDGETVMGEEYMEFFPDENSVKKAVIDCFYKIEE